MSRSVSGGFALKTAVGGNRLMYLTESGENTSLLWPLNSQVLLQPLFPSQTPSIRCGLEESYIHPRAPGSDLVPADLRRVLHHLLARCSTESVCRVLSTDQIHKGQLGRAGRPDLPKRTVP